ncbi:MAG TPA: hypothetical protein VG986_20330 [Pseudolabrys sp.]|nr:hypothetical protein [Pseudolabrys sp.]
MFKRQDPYSYTQFLTLYNNGGETSQPIGVLAVEYRVNLYNDVLVQNQNSVNQPRNQQFLLYCTQRLFLINPGNSSIAPITGSTQGTEYFANYPALIESYMQVVKSSGVTLNLMDYSPHTVNTAVQQTSSAGSSSSQTQGTTSSSTTGSSFSQSSTYGTSVTVGDTFSGATASYEYTTSSSKEQSSTTGQDASASAGRDASSSASMSIKDWGSYASVNPVYVYPTWVFGQEYPWNAIDCRYAGSTQYPGVKDSSGNYISKPNPNQFEMFISNSMAANLYDGAYLYPPSELSMFGLNFVMKCSWRIYVDDSASTEVTLTHYIDYYSASHMVAPSGQSTPAYEPKVYLDKTPATLSISPIATDDQTFSIKLDLNVMGLDPLGVNSSSAIVGFLPVKFIPPATIAPPATSASLPQTFKTIAATNDLMIENATDYGSLTDSGFSVSQACLTANWSSTQNIPYTVVLYFKVIDSVGEYTLNIKHWVAQPTGVQLTIVINEDTSNTITRYVTDIEGEGGDNNILSIALRDLDFGSIDYHDYLQLGLNSISITMQPINSDWAANSGYQIRAISITRG